MSQNRLQQRQGMPLPRCQLCGLYIFPKNSLRGYGNTLQYCTCVPSQDKALVEAREEWKRNIGDEATASETVQRIANVIHAIQIGGRTSELLSYLRDWLADEKRAAAATSAGDVPEHLREFVEVVADGGYVRSTYAAWENCGDCGAEISLDTVHKPDCMVLRAVALLSDKPAAG